MTKIFEDSVIIGVLLVVFPTVLVAAPAEPTEAPNLVIRVYDYADVNRGTRRKAGDVVQRILNRAGVRVAWLDCNDSTKPCTQPRTPTTLILRILTGSRNSRRTSSADACGFAFRPADGTRGTLFNVLADCVREIASSEGISEDLILGHLAAHEIGHLLLPDGKHSRSGLMKSELRTKEWREAKLGRLRFKSDETAQVRIAIQQRALRE